MNPFANRVAILRSNFLNLYGDIIGFGILFGTTLSYLSVYATHLGANTIQLGIITSGPALVNLLVSLPAAAWLRNKPLTSTVFITALIQRTGFFAIIALPWLFSQVNEVWAITILVIVMALPGTLLSVAFNSMFAEVVPPNYRAEIVGRRNAYMSIAIMITTFASGLLLDRLGFPGNYQITFGVGAMGAAWSAFHLGRLRPLPQVEAQSTDPAPVALAPAPKPATPFNPVAMLRLELLRTAFGPLFFTFTAFYISQNMNTPINPLFWVNDIHISDGTIGAGNAIFYAAFTLGSFLLPPLIRRYGLRRVMVASSFAYIGYPLILGLAWDATFFYLASLTSGFVWGIANGCLLNYLMEKVPVNDRPAHMAWHNVALNGGITIGGLLGAGLAEIIGNRAALLTTAGLRLLSAFAMLFWG